MTHKRGHLTAARRPKNTSAARLQRSPTPQQVPARAALIARPLAFQPRPVLRAPAPKWDRSDQAAAGAAEATSPYVRRATSDRAAAARPLFQPGPATRAATRRPARPLPVA